MDIETIVEQFNDHGFVFKDISTGPGELAYALETDKLVIGIFDHTYPNTGYCGKILAEHIENFDKWSKVFYRCDFPTCKEEFQLLLEDLAYIATPQNQSSGNNFGSLTREFI